MKIVGNIIWLVFGGLILPLAYVLAGIISLILIITIPLGVQSLKLASFALWPFGRVLGEDRGAQGPDRLSALTPQSSSSSWAAIRTPWASPAT
jgi:uncharacterized membrane protein YccF (DUF307 family)